MTDDQKKTLIAKINTLNIKQVLKYFLSGEVSLADVPHITPERWKIIKDALASMPNPVEQQEWQAIAAIINPANPSQDQLSKLASYINKWEGLRPQDNHVDEAIALHNQIEAALRAATAQQEDSDWHAVDPFDVDSLMGHLQKYPHTTHKQEIEDSVWDATDKEDVASINQFVALFPSSRHAVEARKMLNAIVEWDAVKQSYDIFAVDDYLKKNPNSPFLQQANIQKMQLKQQEFQKMRDMSCRYDASRLLEMLRRNIVTENELYKNNILTPNVLTTLRDTNVKSSLPDMNMVIAKSTPECKDGFTDVYFLGIPSTGKTCALMGLSACPSLNINFAHGGGDYAGALQQYTDAGITVPRTPGKFVTTLEAEINDDNTSYDIVHRVNLVEMAGESFAFDIANNEDKIYCFEDMGAGATELLKNDNRKVFFLIIDPTSDFVIIQREREGINEFTGEKTVQLEMASVNQKLVLQKIVSIFNHPDNAAIMKKVDSIHVIMTKADLLGDAVAREDVALNIFNQKYSGILKPLQKVCKQYNINKQYKYSPLLYTFSLGTFYVGGLYEYNPTDSDRLLNAICNSTGGYKEESFWDKLVRILN